MANQENTAAEPKKKNLLDRVIGLISSVFLPFITLMVAAGILKGIVALLTAANIIVEGHPLYSVFYAMGDAFFYFIPVFLAFTAAKRFGTEPFCAVLVACVLVHPTFVALMEAGEDFSILGLPAKAMTYSSTVIPILLAVYMLKWVEILCKKVIPETVRAILTPPVCLILVIPVTLVVFGPIGLYIGNWVAAGYQWLYGLSPLVAGFVLGALFQVMVIFGFNWGLFPIILNNIAVNGYDTILALIGGSIFSQSGAALAVGIRTRNKQLRSTAVSAAIAALFGITEPALFGVNIRLKKPMVCACIAGGIGGAIAGWFRCQASAFAFPALTTLPVFWTVAFIPFLISLGVSFVAGFILTLVVGFDDSAIESTAIESES